MSDEEDRKLISAILAGDEAAARAFVQAYKHLVYAVFRRFRLAEADSDDLFQKFFERLLQNDMRALRTWNGTGLPAYLRQIAHNIALDHWRSTRTVTANCGAEDEGEDQSDCDDADPETMLILQERRLIFSQAIQKLAESDQEILRYLLQDLDYEEIASRLGVPVGTAGVRIMRARKRLTRVIRAEFPVLGSYF